MNFTITTWQQAVSTGLFFFVGAFCWSVGCWSAKQLTERIRK